MTRKGDMSGVRAIRATECEETVDLFDRIGVFLRDHGLSPDPAHYIFAHRVLAAPNSAIARAVHSLCDGGIRLSRSNIEELGGQVMSGVSGTMPGVVSPAVYETGAVSKAGALSGAVGGTASTNVLSPSDASSSSSDGLMAQTQMQVDGFTDMVQAMRIETEGFGRDLAASADAMRTTDRLGVGEIVRLTGRMLERVRTAETRLEAATHEASVLRAKLEEARDNARRDPLTDLPNRRAFEEAFASAAATGAPLCIAVCDVDRFKAVNDRFGHAVGDRVLRAIAAALSDSCAGHLVSRYGGEEFAILFSGIDHDAALRTLDEARQTVASKRYRIRGSEEPLGEVTFSAGLTVAATGEALAPVFARADALMYAAKSAGRNQLRAD